MFLATSGEPQDGTEAALRTITQSMQHLYRDDDQMVSMLLSVTSRLVCRNGPPNTERLVYDQFAAVVASARSGMKRRGDQPRAPRYGASGLDNLCIGDIGAFGDFEYGVDASSTGSTMETLDDATSNAPTSSSENENADVILNRQPTASVEVTPLQAISREQADLETRGNRRYPSVFVR